MRHIGCELLVRWLCVLGIVCSVLSQDDQSGCSLGKCNFLKHNCEHDQLKAAKERLAPIVGKRYPAKETDGTSYTVGICTSPEDGSEELGSPGVIQTTKDQKRHSAGSLEKAEIMAGSSYLALEYEGGDKYGSHCRNESRRSIIMIICKPGETNGVLRMIDENNMKDGDCYYLFELDHEAACPESSGGLSVGSIVCIVFFTLLGVYLLGGFLYQRFVVGAKGWEQLPNSAFWEDFGNLQADGCDLICRRGRGGGGARQYRGIGDDQLQTQEEIPERDDHLLPM